MKQLFAIALLAFSVGAVAQPRKIEPQKIQYGHTYQHKKTDFRRLDLSKKQEKQLKDILKDKQREIAKVRGSHHAKMQKLRAIDKKYDTRIERVLTRNQWRMWNQYYAYQYSSHATYRV